MPPPRSDKRRPIMLPILSSLYSLFPVLCSSPFESALFQAISALMFFRAFRPSDLICSSTFDLSDRAMEFRDVLLSLELFHLCLHRSKTDQRPTGRWLI